jgi:voltage-gated potassium channel Kch
LTGFTIRLAERDGLAGETIAAAEKALGARIVAVDGKTEIDGDDRIPPRGRLVAFAEIDSLLDSAPRHIAQARFPVWVRLKHAVRHYRSRHRRRDPFVATLVAAAVLLFIGGTWHFRDSFGSGWLVAAYFVVATITTTGYGDITPHHNDPADVIAAMLLMLLGTLLTGVFIAFVAARLTRAQWVRMQGLRPVHRRGHIVVCGCGSIGSGVIDLLLCFSKPIVVVEQHPDTALVERARDRGFDLLTGDASRDDTLDLCNLDAAHSLVALTNIDTLNLEIALGARARNPSMPIVLRIAEASFAASIARHFAFETTYSVAALAGPVFAGLARLPGARGRIVIDGQEFGIAEILTGPALEQDLPRLAIPLAAAAAGGDFTLIRDFTGLPLHTRALIMVPLAPFRDGRESIATVTEHALQV